MEYIMDSYISWNIYILKMVLIIMNICMDMMLYIIQWIVLTCKK